MVYKLPETYTMVKNIFLLHAKCKPNSLKVTKIFDVKLNPSMTKVILKSFTSSSPNLIRHYSPAHMSCLSMALSSREESYFPPTVICTKRKSTMMGLKPSLWDCLDISRTWAPLDLIHKGPPPSPPLPHLNQCFWPLVNTWNMLLLN
jgi:hypothetical protein